MVGEMNEAKEVLTELLLLLRQNGVKHYEDSGLGLKIVFGERASLTNPLSAPDQIQEPKSQQEVDDEALYWSAR